MGQKEGDRILKVCADLIKEPLRKGDLLARVGGDEFVAILPRTDEKAAEGLIGAIRTAVERHNRQNAELPLSISLGAAVSSSFEQPLAVALKNSNDAMHMDKQNRSESARSQVVKALLAALSERDYISGGHAERLQELCLKMGERIGLDRNSLTALSLVAQVHDLGKVGIPDKILFKDSSLSDAEWEIMRRHPEKGYRIAQTSPDLAPVADLILRHHEKWNGTGYPLGLRGEEIPVECRILSIVDAFDAMTNDRPYRKAKTKQEAIEELKKYSGTQFDPQLIETFIKVV
jgi:HD-GYP domain-containing protein (c-di-GMP phosphodiesterase class II)